MGTCATGIRVIPCSTSETIKFYAKFELRVAITSGARTWFIQLGSQKLQDLAIG